MWLTALPYLVQIIGWILGRYNASKETMAAFQKLVQSAKDDGLIAVQAKDIFEEQRQELEKTKPE